MSQKRNRSINWDEEEKQLLRYILKEYAAIIENKSLDNNTNKKKCKAWEKVHKKFNELNVRPRQLDNLKIQWKTMKINARKTYNTFKNETNKTGGGVRPTTPTDVIIEIKDLLNPAELLRDYNIFDSDGIVGTDNVVIPISLENDIVQENENIAEPSIPLNTNEQEDFQKLLTESMIAQDTRISVMVTPKYMDPISEQSQQKRKIPSKRLIKEHDSKSRKDNDYVDGMIAHSKILKTEEHMRRMEMAEEEHEIKMAIHKEKLKSAILEREILELKKKCEEKNCSK